METPMISRTRPFKLADEEEEQSRPVTVIISLVNYFNFPHQQILMKIIIFRNFDVISINCSFQKALELEQNNIQIPHARPETPRNVTHTHDEDCSDEDSDSQKHGNQKLCTKKTPQL